VASWAVAIIDAKRHPGLDPGSQTLEIVQLLFATLNPGKQLEIKKLLADTGVHLVFPQDANLLDLKVDETGQTFAQNSALKATAFGLKSGLLTAADDSGLEISSLDNFPGVKSDRWLKGTWEEKNLGILEKLNGKTNRQARFVTNICLFDPQTQELKHFVGTILGNIADQKKGQQGFGYDPIFIPEGETRTWGELGPEAKNQHSHRQQALKALHEYMSKALNE